MVCELPTVFASFEKKSVSCSRLHLHWISRPELDDRTTSGSLQISLFMENSDDALHQGQFLG